MFTVSFRLKRKKLLCICGIAVLALIVSSIIYLSCGGAKPYDVNAGEVPENIAKVALDTNEARVSFLRSFGWEVSDSEREIVDVQLPSETDEVIGGYNEIQKAQGLDIEKYLGKKVVRYTYDVKNYPDRPQNVRANIIMYGKKLIAGDICSVEIDGFMHGFEPPEDIKAKLQNKQ